MLFHIKTSKKFIYCSKYTFLSSFKLENIEKQILFLENDTIGNLFIQNYVL